MQTNLLTKNTRSKIFIWISHQTMDNNQFGVWKISSGNDSIRTLSSPPYVEQSIKQKLSCELKTHLEFCCKKLISSTLKCEIFLSLSRQYRLGTWNRNIPFLGDHTYKHVLRNICRKAVYLQGNQNTNFYPNWECWQKSRHQESKWF